jgi:kynurenine formamidase
MVQALNRRDFLKTTSLGAAAAAANPTPSANAADSPADLSLRSIQFNQVVDLTHTLTPEFPTWSGRRQFALESVSTLARDGWNVNRWTLDEHTGTHLDAPFHKARGASADLISAQDLIGPLAVLDMRARAAAQPDAQLTLDDLKQWEARHGPLPRGGIVALCSGWDAHVRSPKFRNADDQGRLHFPGFHVEAIDFLLAARHVKGIVVDTLSLDRGLSTDFPVHLRWLGNQRWGVECAAQLGQLPASGATLMVGGPKVAGASGGPSRLLALI